MRSLSLRVPLVAAFGLASLLLGCSDDPAPSAEGGESDSGADAVADAAADTAEAGVDAANDATTDVAVDAPYPYPKTCAEARDDEIAAGASSVPDGTYTLYLGGDATKPWDAFCRRMADASPAEYLTVDPARNSSQQGDGVGFATTEYRRFRVDPAGPALLALDAAFATTTDARGLLADTSFLPVGFARYASATPNAGGAATARVDLTGTPFVFGPSLTDAGYFHVRSSLGDATAIAGSTVTIQADVSGFVLTALSTAAADTVVVSPYAADVLTSSPAIESVTLPLEYVVP